MISIEFAKYFQSITIIIVFILSIIAMNKWKVLGANDLLYKNRTNLTILIMFCLIYCIILGHRPLSGRYFGDTAIYGINFYRYKNGGLTYDVGGKDWLFDWLMSTCTKFGDVSLFFTIVVIGYIFFAMAGIYRLFKNNTYGAMLFFFGAFSFFSYATNGIRNGLACSLFIFGSSFFIEKSLIHRWIIGGGLCYIATFIHHSVMLPLVCLIASLFIKNIKIAILFWFFSIFLFLTARDLIESFFTGIGFDDRLTDYIESSEEYALHNTSGFRLDFLIYSFMPILLGWYVTNKSHIHIDKTYNYLINTYIFANSFWIMLMNAAYSNRFAYLSWFMYPIVLAYPCLRMNVWGNRQGVMAGSILFYQVAFTVFMHFLYY